MKRKRSLVGTIRLVTTLSFLCLSLLILFLELALHKRDYINRRKELTENFYKDQSAFMKEDIERILDRLNYQSTQVTYSTKKEVKERTHEGYTIAMSIYENGKDIIPEERLKRDILEMLRLLTYRSGTGYYFVIGLDGITHMNKYAPFVEGMDRTSAQNEEGVFFVREMIDLVKERGDGYYTYRFSRPGDRESQPTKTSYLMVFEPYGWIIGTGLYDVDIMADLQKSLIASIEYVFSEKRDYLTIVRKDGTVLMGPKKGINILESGTEREKERFREELDLAERGGGMLEYSWVTPEGFDCQRLVYVRDMEKWDWLITTGMYTEELEHKIIKLEYQIHNTQRKEIVRIITMTLISCFVLVILLNMINRYFFYDLSYFSRFFKQTAMDDIPMDKDKLRYRELADLGDYTNQMVKDKRSQQEEKRKLRNLESLGFLAAGIAHDFNNALMGIFGNIELTMVSLDDEESARLYLERALEAMDSTKELTNRFLTFARGGHSNIQTVPLNELLSGIEKKWQGKGNFQFVNRVLSDDFPVLGDRDQLTLALNLLIMNSDEAMKDGGTLTVRAEQTFLDKAFPARLSGNYIRLEISDTGCGIEREILEKVFDPYFTTKQTGHGLGLPTVYNIMKQHRGHVEARSEKGVGTTVSLYLPKANVPTEAESDDPV